MKKAIIFMMCLVLTFTTTVSASLTELYEQRSKSIILSHTSPISVERGYIGEIAQEAGAIYVSFDVIDSSIDLMCEYIPFPNSAIELTRLCMSETLINNHVSFMVDKFLGDIGRERVRLVALENSLGAVVFPEHTMGDVGWDDVSIILFPRRDRDDNLVIAREVEWVRLWIYTTYNYFFFEFQFKNGRIR